MCTTSIRFQPETLALYLGVRACGQRCIHAYPHIPQAHRGGLVPLVGAWWRPPVAPRQHVSGAIYY